MIAIVDYDTGNLRSVCNALHRIGVEYELTENAQKIIKADKVLLPGVGEASSAMRKLQERGLEDVIKGLTQPVFGICIGMQLMCRRSDEGETQCLSIFDTNVTKFSADILSGIKVPHMGWNEVSNLQSPLFKELNEEEYFYFVHSYAPEICQHTIATSQNGRLFSAALQNGNFFGTQFHPEKSGMVGEKLLRNFLEL